MIVDDFLSDLRSTRTDAMDLIDYFSEDASLLLLYHIRELNDMLSDIPIDFMTSNIHGSPYLVPKAVLYLYFFYIEEYLKSSPWETLYDLLD